MIKILLDKINKIKDDILFERSQKEAISYNKCFNELKKYESLLIGKPCAVNNFSKCNAECVHYTAGSISSLVWDGKVWYVYNEPKCKLWSA